MTKIPFAATFFVIASSHSIFAEPVLPTMIELGCTRTQNLTWAAVGVTEVESSPSKIEIRLQDLDTSTVYGTVSLSGLYKPSPPGGRTSVAIDGPITVNRIDPRNEIATVPLKLLNVAGVEDGPGLVSTQISFTLFVTENVGRKPKCSTKP